MRVFVVAGISLNVNKYRHCGFEIELAAQFAAKQQSSYESTFKALLDRNDDDSIVIEKFRKEICAHLTKIYAAHDMPLRLADWTFDLRFTELDKDRFWLRPATSCGTFSSLRVTRS
jgi:hypothetical protein